MILNSDDYEVKSSLNAVKIFLSLKDLRRLIHKYVGFMKENVKGILS